jgi:predicted transcriptional regulator
MVSVLLYDGKCMEVDLTPDLEAKLASLAAEQGRDTKALVREAVERFVSYDEWFIREVEKGLAAADRGEFIEHEEIGKLIDRRYPGYCVFAGQSPLPATSHIFATTSRNVTARQRPGVRHSQSIKA